MPNTPPGQITRRLALEAFRRLPPGCAITTLGLAFILDCPEHRVRGAVSWLAAGGLVVDAGRYPRKDRRGKAYSPKLWAWRGQEEIRKLRRDPTERQVVREADVQALAAEWLSRRW